jgi:hypothetical protein
MIDENSRTRCKPSHRADVLLARWDGYRRLSWPGVSFSFSFSAGELAGHSFAMGTPQSLLLLGLFLPFFIHFLRDH